MKIVTQNGLDIITSYTQENQRAKGRQFNLQNSKPFGKSKFDGVNARWFVRAQMREHGLLGRIS